jgi:hypothetical protein
MQGFLNFKFQNSTFKCVGSVGSGIFDREEDREGRRKNEI